jgi:hypothetical protein
MYVYNKQEKTQGLLNAKHVLHFCSVVHLLGLINRSISIHAASACLAAKGHFRMSEHPAADAYLLVWLACNPQKDRNIAKIVLI